MKNKVRSYFQFTIIALILIAILRPLLNPSYHPDFEAYCPLGGIASLMSKLNLGSLSCTMSEVQVTLGIILIIGAVLFGKLFCSYICPIGAVSEWLGKLGDKLKINIRIPEYVDRPLRILKYLLLYATIYFTMNSSELFCREFDPYFASVTGFGNNDIVWYFAVATIAVVIIGSIVTRMFWCKYLCPLGAIGNIFMNVVVAAGVIIIYLIANLLGANLGLFWLVTGIIFFAMLTEVIFKKSLVFPLTKIKRKTDSCPTCHVCDKNCPQGIEIDKYDTVDNIDCTLCSDCIYSCPVKETLFIKKSVKFSKWIAPVATVLLIVVGLTASSFYEFKTLSDRWGNFSKIKNIKVYEQTGLKNVKCFSSSKSFERQIKRIKGIYGLDAYASSHTVKIYYNPSEITPLRIKRDIFKPVTQKVRRIRKGIVDSLDVLEVGIKNFFDNVDYVNLSYAFMKDKGIYGFQTMFGEPVKAKIYYNSKITSPENIRKIIESEEVEIRLRDGGTLKREMDFKVEGETRSLGKVSVADYEILMFKKYDRKFNGYSKYKPENLKVLAYPMPEAASGSLYRMLSYLTSHLSNWKGIVRLSTRYNKVPTAYVFFVPEKISLEEVKKAIASKMLKVHFSNGTTKEVRNPFKSKPEGKVTSALNLIKNNF